MDHTNLLQSHVGFPFFLTSSVGFIIDRVEEGLKTEVIHVMFYNEVYVVALGPSLYLFITPAKARETYCVNAYISERLRLLLNHMPPDGRYQLETNKI